MEVLHSIYHSPNANVHVLCYLRIVRNTKWVTQLAYMIGFSFLLKVNAVIPPLTMFIVALKPVSVNFTLKGRLVASNLIQASVSYSENDSPLPSFGGI